MTAAQGIYPLCPEKGGRDTGERNGGRHRDRISDGKKGADIDAVGEAEDAVVEEELTDEQKRLVQEKMGGRRPAFTREVAGVVGMLCTEDGGWCTGSVVCANGGMRMGI